MSDKKKEPEKKEIRPEDEISHTITILICRIMMLISLAWFTGSFFKWCDVYEEKEFYLAWGSFLFALFWIILLFASEREFRGTGQDDEPKSDAIGFDAENDGDNSEGPV